MSETKAPAGNDAWPAWHCPAHGEELHAGGGSLLCPAGHSFRVEAGIPRFVPAHSYADAFGLQWKQYRRTQLDSYTGTTITRDRVRRCLGEDLWRRLDGMHVLEAGCGAGRFTEILLERGARVTSVDLSAAVEANQDNFPQDERHRIAQASILELPFAEGAFDMVFCLGVVQHTPEPEATIAALFRQVRPGGSLVFDHYAYSLSLFTKTVPLVRAVLKRLPAEVGMAWSRRMVDVLFPLHRAVKGKRLAQMALSRVSPVQTYFHAHPELSDELQYEWALLDTHDSLTDRYKHLRTRRSLAATIRRLGGADVFCARGGNGVEVRCRRPVASTADPSLAGSLPGDPRAGRSG